MNKKTIFFLLPLFILIFVACSGADYVGEPDKEVTIRPATLHVYPDGSIQAAEDGVLEGLEQNRVGYSAWSNIGHLSEWQQFQYTSADIDENDADLLHHLNAFMSTEMPIRCETYRNGILCSEMLINTEGDISCLFGSCFYQGMKMAQEHQLDGVDDLQIFFFNTPEGEVVIHK